MAATPAPTSAAQSNLNVRYPWKFRSCLVLLFAINLAISAYVYFEIYLDAGKESNSMLLKESNTNSSQILSSSDERQTEVLRKDMKDPCGCDEGSETGAGASPAVQMEDPLLQAQYGLYTLCPPHYVVSPPTDAKTPSDGLPPQHWWGLGGQSGEGFPVNSSDDWPIVDASTLPNLPYLRTRYTRMYSHWHAAMSRLRAKLVNAGEPPYALRMKMRTRQSDETQMDQSSIFDSVLQQAVKAAGLTLISPTVSSMDSIDGIRNGRADREVGTGNNWSTSTWANDRASYEGFCSFSRSVKDHAGMTVSSAPMPKVLTYDGSLMFYGYDGLTGPQGDIMQWCDLLIALHLIGYASSLTFPLTYSHPCPSLEDYDVVFIDYAALLCRQCSYRQGFYTQGSNGAKCKVRLLDLFGTEEMHNSGTIPGEYSGVRLPSLRQYLSLQPDYSPGNTFLGFVSFQGTTPLS